jgi:hypothetical protein
MLISNSVIRAKGKVMKKVEEKYLEKLCKNGPSCLPTSFFFLIGAEKAGINHSNK